MNIIPKKWIKNSNLSSETVLVNEEGEGLGHVYRVAYNKGNWQFTVSYKASKEIGERPNGEFRTRKEAKAALEKIFTPNSIRFILELSESK